MFESRTAAQINVYPMDVRHWKFLLPHQIRVWEPMVERIVVTIDVHRSRSGRYRGTHFEENLVALRTILAEMHGRYPQLLVSEVDYSDEARRAVARYFFGGDAISIKAWDGGPFYSYFYGLYSARARYIVHFDSDMLFGGGSRQWLTEAIALMEQRPDVLLVNPFPGPPRADGRVYDDRGIADPTAQREPTACLAYRFQHASTRIFTIDMERFEQRLHALPRLPPTAWQRFKSRMLGNTAETREAEVNLSHALVKFGMYRIDYLGSAPGLWSLHPPYRSEDFYARLPEIVRMVETGNVPEAQRGFYDLNDSIVDWSKPRAANRWHQRYWRLLRDRLLSPS